MEHNTFINFFKYVYFFVVQILSFIMMYNKNLELMGLISGILIATITHIFLVMNIFSSDKTNELVLYFILFSIILFFVSSVLMIKTLVHLHSKYSVKGSPILLTKENRKRFDRYKKMFISSIILIGLLAFSFFTLPNNKKWNDISKTINPQYESEVDTPEYKSYYHLEKIWNYDYINNSVFSIMPTIISSFMKVGASLSVLGMTSYMVYLTNFLSKINANQLYIPPPKQSDLDHSQFTIGNKFSFADIYKNINMNYLTNYIPDVNI